MKNWMKGWGILWAVVVLGGCASSRDVQILDGEIYKLQSQWSQIQKERNSLKMESEAFQKETQKELSAQRNESQRAQADLLLRLENLQSELRVLSTGIEEYKEFAKKPSKEIDRVREDIVLRTRILEEREKNLEGKNKALEDRSKALEEWNRGLEDRSKVLEERNRGLEDRLKGLEGKMEKIISKAAESEKAVSAKEAPPEIKGVSAAVGDLYKDAYETYQKGDLEGARRKFEAFLKQYPNTELSDNAQFWIGETYYLKKDFEKAILEYEKAIAKYPEGDKIPAALFKQALAFQELGDKTNARNLLKRVIERYPQSDQAEMAKKKLETIK